jgi:hypothetical protein
LRRAGALLEARGHHTATLLDDGRILVVGGGAGPDAPTRSAELWDPATRSFSAADSLADARGGHSATLLPDHRVLVIGGYGAGGIPLASTEIWDPVPDATGLRWVLESTGRDWPGPLRQGPPGGARTVPADRHGADIAGDDFSWEYVFRDRSERMPDASPWLDIREVRFRRQAVIELAEAPPPDMSDPTRRWVAYGFVLDMNGDGAADIRLGIDNARGGGHRAWRTDLVTGETIAQTGPAYGFPTSLADTWYPGEEGAPDYALFHGGGITPTRLLPWASEIRDGRIVATDFAPDSGWLTAGAEE